MSEILPIRTWHFQILITVLGHLVTRLYLVLLRKVSISEGHKGRYSVEFTS